jgi:hypothetical protein
MMQPKSKLPLCLKTFLMSEQILSLLLKPQFTMTDFQSNHKTALFCQSVLLTSWKMGNFFLINQNPRYNCFLKPIRKVQNLHVLQ